ncbi:MAG: cation:proton antiporter [Rhodothermales bacterium]
MPVFAAGTVPPFFVDVALLILASAAIAYLCYRLGIIPIVGFLITGVIIGPKALGIVSDPEIVNAAAEVGVLLLLFTIGIEFSLEKLARIQRLIFGAGGLQVGLATVLTMGILLAFGVSWQASLFTGFLVALSSTAIVLKLLGDSGEIDEPHGQVGLGLLIFQDLAIILMVLLVPLLSGDGGSPLAITWALGKAVLIIVAVLLVARRIMPIFLEKVARTCSAELFLLTVIGICFGTAYLTSLAGVSLSLGAFLAGIVVSESRFSEHAMGEIMPLQILFSATFFVSVGMLLDLGFLMGNLPLVLGVVVLVIVLKVVTTGVAVRALGYPLPIAAGSAFMLAQIGEFSFVLERTGREAGLYPAGMAEAGSQTFIAATVLVMILTPTLNSFGNRLRERLTPYDAPAPDTDDPDMVHGHLPELSGHVIVAGFGDGARVLCRILHGQGIPHVVLTLSPHGATEAEDIGIPVLRGDYSRQRTLELAHVSKAAILVIPDDLPGMAHRVAQVARTLNPDMQIIARTRSRSDVEGLRHAGADLVAADELESILELTERILESRERPADAIHELLQAIRTGSPNAHAASTVSPESMTVELVLKGDGCAHTGDLHPVQVVEPTVCQACREQGDSWVHLRVCMTCGHVGCCDSSKNKHATRHFQETGHAVMRSIEPGETWGWCYVDEKWLK